MRHSRPDDPEFEATKKIPPTLGIPPRFSKYRAIKNKKYIIIDNHHQNSWHPNFFCLREPWIVAVGIGPNSSPNGWSTTI